ncbi:hypothetical protein GCM10025870_11560 [Agromyces marinus]|uniref:Uncharacterized protein n=1 Tax=Agromyces marinus TaxID=1389020 RepID=A0ABN6YF99_9MICO|nr:hypothetical protein GCM10025870_11560 [Agromyces marinus]
MGERGLGQGDAELVAHIGERVDALEDRRRRGCVVVGGIRCRPRPGEQAGVVDRGRDDADAALERGGEQVVERALFEERVPAGEHDDVDVVAADELGGHRGLVHPGPDRTDDALLAQFDERRDGLGVRLLAVVVGVVQVGDVDPVEPEALEARVDRAADAVAAEVPLATQRRRHREALVVHGALGVSAGHEESPDLRREHVLVAGTLAQRLAEAAFAEPEPVVGAVSK